MNILILTNKPPYPPKDGGAIAVFNLAKGIANEGHNVHILSLNTSKHWIDCNNIPSFPNLKLTYIDIDTSINIFDLALNICFSKLPYNAKRFISQPFLNQLTNILTSNVFDIVQLEGPYLSFCIETIKLHSKAKIALRSHNIEHEIWQRTALKETSWPKRQYLKHLALRIERFEKGLTNKYDFILPITSRDGIILNNMGNTKPSFVVPVGVDAENLASFTLNNNNSIFYIGALDWIPNQEGLQWFINNIWGHISSTYPNLILHIAGRNAPEWLKNTIQQKNIKFHGEVENAYAFMENHDIMIVPLFSGSGMRVKIIEGMAMGKAIITTPLGAEGIDITDNENILIAHNADVFKNKLTSLLNNKALLTKISEQAKSFIQNNYDNSVIAKKLSEFYIKQLNQ